MYKNIEQFRKAHPEILAFSFEANFDKWTGFGELEEVCGYCLASHYFDDEPPKRCLFCRAPLQETHFISDLPDVKNEVFELAADSQPEKPRPFIVPRRKT